MESKFVEIANADCTLDDPESIKEAIRLLIEQSKAKGASGKPGRLVFETLVESKT
jgi:hypothetical protein